jgi:hypothetical protein
MHQNQPSGRPKALRRADFDSLPDRIKPKSSPEWQVPARKFLLCAILHVQITATIKHGPHNMFPINQTPRQQVHRPCPPRTPRSLTADGGEECTMAKPLRPPAPRIDSTTGARVHFGGLGGPLGQRRPFQKVWAHLLEWSPDLPGSPRPPE